jgi:hypothetical protein
LDEQRSIAQAYNQVEQKGMDLLTIQRAFYRFLKRTVLSRLVRQEFEEQEQKYYLVRKEG